MTTLRFCEDHEWVAVEGDTGTVGITNHAQDCLLYTSDAADES